MCISRMVTLVGAYQNKARLAFMWRDAPLFGMTLKIKEKRQGYDSRATQRALQSRWICQIPCLSSCNYLSWKVESNQLCLVWERAWSFGVICEEAMGGFDCAALRLGVATMALWSELDNISLSKTGQKNFWELFLVEKMLMFFSKPA